MAADHGLDVRSAFLPTGSAEPGQRSWLAQENAACSLKRALVKGVRTAGGDGLITEVDLAALLDRYDVTSELSRQRLRNLNRGPRGTGWWNAFRNEVSALYLRYARWGAEAAHALQVAGCRFHRVRLAAGCPVRRGANDRGGWGGAGRRVTIAMAGSIG